MIRTEKVLAILTFLVTIVASLGGIYYWVRGNQNPEATNQASPAPPGAPDKPDDADFASLFDAKPRDRSHVSAQTGHSKTSGNKTGGRWVVEDGAIVGSQDVPGNGGIVITDKQYGDFEVALEMKNDFGPDSGLFLRCDEKGRCYQAMIDYHAGG